MSVSPSPPAQLHRKVPAQRERSRHPAHLPAAPALLDTKDGADPMSDKVFLGSGGETPWGWREEEETRRSGTTAPRPARHGAADTGATSRTEAGILPGSHGKENRDCTTDRDTKGTAGVSTSLPARSDNKYKGTEASAPSHWDVGSWTFWPRRTGRTTAWK